MDKDIKTTNHPTPAVAGQVEFGVRPCAWTARSWLANRDGGHFVPKRRHAFDVPLYSQAALDAAVAAARERLCEALKIEMQHSAWDGVLHLDDALLNIADALAQGPNVRIQPRR